MQKSYKRLITRFIGFLIIVTSIIIPHELFSRQKNDSISDALKLFEKGKLYSLHAKYDSSIICFNQASQLFNQIGNEEFFLKSKLFIANALRQLEDFTLALERIVEIENDYSDYLSSFPSYQADVLHVKGSVLGDKGSHVEAINVLKESLRIRGENNNKPDSLLANTYSNIGTYYFMESDLEKAREYYEKALEAALDRNESGIDPDIAMIYMNIGIVHAVNNDLAKAMEYFEKNLKINSQIFDPGDPALADIYTNIGRLKNLLKLLDEALYYYNKADSLYVLNFGPEHTSLGGVYLNKGNIYKAKNDKEKALEYYKKAYQIFNTHFEKGHKQISNSLNNIGAVYFSKGMYDLALEHYTRSLGITKDPILRTIILRNLGRTHEELGDDQQANFYFVSSVNFALDTLKNDHHELAKSYIALGEYCLKLNKGEESLPYFINAYNIYIRNFGHKNPNVSYALSNIGDYYYMAGSYKKALNYYQKALISGVYDFNDTNYLSNPGVDSIIVDYDLIKPILGKARTLYTIYRQNTNKLDDLHACLDSYNLGIIIVDKVKSHLREESKLQFARDVREIYRSAINVCFDLYSHEGDNKYLEYAFRYSEKERSAVLLASLRDIEAIKFGGIPDSLQNLETELKKEIRRYDKLIYEEKQKISQDIETIILWEGKLFELNKQYDGLVNTFESKYQSYFNLKFNTEVVESDKLSSTLNANSVFIEYAMYDSILFTFVITKDDFTIDRTILTDSFYVAINELFGFYQNSLFNHSRAIYEAYLRSANTLYNILLKPYNNLIEDRDLIIVPDGILGYIPFETLITEMPTGENLEYRDIAYLIRSNPVSYSYSATLLTDPGNELNNDISMVAFAPIYGILGKANSNSVYFGSSDTVTLYPLLYTGEEVTQVEELFEGLTLKGKNATKENFISNSGNFSILHLAMHTLIDDNNPLYSKLIFTSDSVINEDEYIHTYELFALDLNAQLAVLSACNTGTGQLRDGEGIMNLARGFAYAGVPSIVMTLWEVEDKSGAEIMTSFYHYLKKGKSKSEALRLAKIEYLCSVPQFRAHPYFWSAYVCVGNSNPIIHRMWITILAFTVLALVILSVLIVLYRKRSMKIK